MPADRQIRSGSGSYLPVAAIAMSTYLRDMRGCRNEEIIRTDPDCRVVHLARSKSPGARRRCRTGCSVGRGRIGAGWCGGGCDHRIYGGTLDLAFVGRWPILVATP